MTLAYSDAWVKRMLGYTPAATDSTGNWTQADVTDAITDGYNEVNLRTGSSSGTNVDLAVKQFVVASWRDAERNRIAKGGSQVSGVISANFPSVETLWTRFDNTCKQIKQNAHLIFSELATSDFSEVNQ